MSPRAAVAVLGAKGFRSFFVLAGVQAALVVPLWLLVWTGRLALRGPLQGIIWHGHEMVHGFSVAVIAGFLLTAVGNWTGRETVTGPALVALATLWALARLALVLVPGWPGAALDLAFLPLLALALARPILATNNRRNIKFLLILAALWLANLGVWLDVAGVLPGLAVRADRAAVYLIAVIILVMAGRVVPMFTRNATGVTSLRNLAGLDAVAIGATAVVAALQLWPLPAVEPWIAGLAGVATLGRMATWGTVHTTRQPLLWVLHLGHAAVGIGLCMLALQPWLVPVGSLPLHALTVGGIGLVTLGMMARVSLGHTGRPLAAGAAMTVSFLCVVAAVLVRVLGPWVLPAQLTTMLWIAALLWGGGFAIFTARYLPVLLAPRVDGKAG